MFLVLSTPILSAINIIVFFDFLTIDCFKTVKEFIKTSIERGCFLFLFSHNSARIRRHGIVYRTYSFFVRVCQYNHSIVIASPLARDNGI